LERELGEKEVAPCHSFGKRMEGRGEGNHQHEYLLLERILKKENSLYVCIERGKKGVLIEKIKEKKRYCKKKPAVL